MRGIGFGFLALAFVSTVAEAQGAQDRAAAHAAYGRGQELFREGRYAEAEVAFEEAYGLIPLPVVLLSIAESRQRQEDIPGAVEALERYLQQAPPTARDRAEIEGRVAELRQRPATLVIRTTPTGASISVDGQVVAQPMGHEVEHQVPPGSHEVSASLEGHETATQTVEATFGARHEIDLTLLSAEPVAPPPEPARSRPPVVEDDGELKIGTEVWIAGGIALAGVAAGSILGLLALSEQSDFDAMPTEDTADTGETLALFADLSFGVAAVAAITGVVLLVTSGDDDEEARAAVGGFQLTPVVGSGTVGLAGRAPF
jgi:tetratricopeptide (TPR) repeat protein